MKFKRVKALLCAVLTFSAVSFSGCSENTDKYEKMLDIKNPVKITIWHYYNGVQQISFENMVSEFNDTIGAEKGIIVEAYTKSTISDLAQSVLDSINNEVGAEKTPDIFAAYSETAYIVDNLGMAADMNKYITSDEKSEYIDNYIKEGEFSGKDRLIIFPTGKSTEVMLINDTDWKKFADETGASYDDLATWEGVAETAEKYYDYTDALTPDIEYDGKALFGRDSIANYMLIGAKQLGHEFFNTKDGEFSFSSDKDTVRKLWENYYVPYVKGYYLAKGRYRSDDVKTGYIIAAAGSTTGASYFPAEVTINDDYTYPVDTAVLPVPKFEGSDMYIVQQGAGMVVTKSDEVHEYASSVFLKWFTEAERNIEFSVNSGYLPVKKEANSIEKIKSVTDEKQIEVKPVLMKVLETAVDEVNNAELYVYAPFDNAEKARNFLGDYMQNTADEAYNSICECMEAGEEREALIAEYTDDAAFEKWYDGFINGINEIIQ